MLHFKVPFEDLRTCISNYNNKCFFPTCMSSTFIPCCGLREEKEERLLRKTFLYHRHNVIQI